MILVPIKSHGKDVSSSLPPPAKAGLFPTGQGHRAPRSSPGCGNRMSPLCVTGFPFLWFFLLVWLVVLFRRASGNALCFWPARLCNEAFTRKREAAAGPTSADALCTGWTARNCRARQKRSTAAVLLGFKPVTQPQRLTAVGEGQRRSAVHLASEQFRTGFGLRLLVVPTGTDLTIVVQRGVTKGLGALPPRKKTSRRPWVVLAKTLPLKYAQQRFSDLTCACFLPCPEANKLSPQRLHAGVGKGFALVQVELFLFTLLKVTGVTRLLKPNQQATLPLFLDDGAGTKSRAPFVGALRWHKFPFPVVT